MSARPKHQTSEVALNPKDNTKFLRKTETRKITQRQEKGQIQEKRFMNTTSSLAHGSPKLGLRFRASLAARQDSVRKSAVLGHAGIPQIPHVLQAIGSQGAVEKNPEKPESVHFAPIVKYTYTQNLPPVPTMGQVLVTA
ncbi:hypothetical protein MG293_020530 [Ovis ammon polii]|uniref:Uncharacterized protein n=1 Tax=Ovis ammon polii TaxID=230172 RepID=A0AAD4TMP4_OVIAM|nr:hypothetical protein MG293_020530 [Ovis ammon polii]